MLIGVTGGIGVGKTYVAGLLGEFLDAKVLSADVMCRELLEPGMPGYRQVTAQWGERFLDETGAIARSVLRQQVFADAGVRKRLEAIVHPMVRTRLREAAATAGAGEFIVAEVPLLFECGWHDDFDWIICVHAEPEQAVERVVERDGVAVDDVLAVIATQLDPGEKWKRADTVVENSGNRAQTKQLVAACARKLRCRFLISAK